MTQGEAIVAEKACKKYVEMNLEGEQMCLFGRDGVVLVRRLF